MKSKWDFLIKKREILLYANTNNVSGRLGLHNQLLESAYVDIDDSVTYGLVNRKRETRVVIR